MTTPYELEPNGFINFPGGIRISPGNMEALTQRLRTLHGLLVAALGELYAKAVMDADGSTDETDLSEAIRLTGWTHD